MASTKKRNINHTTINNDELPEITAIFFDLDNTLIPTRSGDAKACREVSEQLQQQCGFTKDEAIYTTQTFLKSFRHCPDNCQSSLDIWRQHLWRESLPPKYKHLAEAIYPKWLELRYRYLAIPDDFVKMLQRLRQNDYTLALVTNGPSNGQWEKIHKLNVQQYFDCVLVSGDLPWEKPNANIFYTACKYLNVQPRKCCMVGDKLESDIKGGNLAGLGATFWLPLSREILEDLPDYIEENGDENKPTIILSKLLDFYKYFNVTAKRDDIEEVTLDVEIVAGGEQQKQPVPVYKCQSDNFYCSGRSSPPLEFSISESDNSSDSI